MELYKYFDRAEKELLYTLQQLKEKVLSQVQLFERISGIICPSRGEGNMPFGIVLSFYILRDHNEDEGVEISVGYQHTTHFSGDRPFDSSQIDYNRIFILSDVTMMGKSSADCPMLNEMIIELKDNPNMENELNEALKDIKVFINEQAKFIVNELNNYYKE